MNYYKIVDTNSKVLGISASRELQSLDGGKRIVIDEVEFKTLSKEKAAKREADATAKELARKDGREALAIKLGITEEEMKLL